MHLFEYTPGSLPLLWSAPHPGLYVPARLEARMTPVAALRADTDWHMPQLYRFASAMGAHMLHATHSRYVIDLNRDPSGKPLYAGADNTELCPTSTSKREPLYRSGQEPAADEIAERTARYWQPYHHRLADTLAAIKAQHGYALLFDAHSIKSVLPRFFAGRLPDINLGTADGQSAPLALGAELLDVASRFGNFSSVLNGRFKGGYITRAHGKPEGRVYAVQLELTWRCYMDEEDGLYRFDRGRAAGIEPALQAIIERYVAWGQAQA